MHGYKENMQSLMRSIRVPTPARLRLVADPKFVCQVLQDPHIVEWVDIAGNRVSERAGLGPLDGVLGIQGRVWIDLLQTLQDGGGLGQYGACGMRFLNFGNKSAGCHRLRFHHGHIEYRYAQTS